MSEKKKPREEHVLRSGWSEGGERYRSPGGEVGRMWEERDGEGEKRNRIASSKGRLHVVQRLWSGERAMLK